MTVPVPILLYHSISGRASQRFRPWTLDPGLFEEHMELLVERGFAAVTLSHLIAAVWVDRQELPPNPVVTPQLVPYTTLTEPVVTSGVTQPQQ